MVKIKNSIKNLIVLLFFAMVTSFGFAQIKSPVSWNYTAKKIDAKTYEVHMTANVEGGWHIYSQNTPDGGPVATTIVFGKNPLLSTDGATKEVGKLEQHMEPLFGVNVKQFSDKVDFVQKVTMKSRAKTKLTGTIEYMVCNDKECLPPKEQKFSIAL